MISRVAPAVRHFENEENIVRAWMFLALPWNNNMIAKYDCSGKIRKIKLTNLYKKEKELTGIQFKMKFIIILQNYQT